MQQRRPRGYVGTNHETIGSDILSLLQAVIMPEQVLGREMVERLHGVRAAQWYPIQWLLDPLQRLEATIGASSLRKIGLAIFQLSHEAALKRHGKSVRDVVYGIDAMYHHANRGDDIGGWRVLEFKPGEAILEKTTPHPCVLEEGILEAGVRAMGVSSVSIEQPECMRRSADACRIRLVSHVVDQRWTG
jgi:hypothetical protein